MSWALGEPEYRDRSVIALAVAIVFGPAILIAFLKKRWQWALLSLLFGLFLWEKLGGVTITNQLNHEGSDLGFTFMRAATFIVFLAGLEIGRTKVERADA
jgi:hypothetical protein